MSLLSSYNSSTPLARTPQGAAAGRSEYSSSILSSCSCGKSPSCSDGRCSMSGSGGGSCQPPDKFNFSEQVGIVNSASSLIDDQISGSRQEGAGCATAVWPSGRCGEFVGKGGGVMSKAASGCLPGFTSSRSACARAKECYTNESSALSNKCCCPRESNARPSAPDRMIDKAAAEIIAIARRLTEREIGQHALAELTPQGGGVGGADSRGFSVREIMHEEVRRLEDKLHKAECLEKEVEKGLQNDRSLLERVEETLVSLGREESRLLWKAEELGRRCETMDIIHRSRGQGCVSRLKQEAERLRRLIEELETQEAEASACAAAGTVSPRAHNPLIHLKAALDSEKCEVLDILERLRGEKGNQLNRAKELRTQIFDDRRKLDLMLEKHIHLVQEINRLKTSAARNISSDAA